MVTKKLLYRCPILLMFVAVIVTCMVVSCGKNPKIDSLLTKADDLMEQHPDSSMAILSGMDQAKLGSDKERARYALLMSMALDKNYVDTTTFDVLQPAIDYYLDKNKGPQDEKLKTYYYQGRIFMNQGKDDYAMASFMNGGDLKGVTDSIALARLLVAKSIMYYNQYKLEDVIKCSLSASRIYKSFEQPEAEFDCLLKSLNGLISLKDKHKADSVLAVCKILAADHPELGKGYEAFDLMYKTSFGSKNDIRKTLSSIDVEKVEDSSIYIFDIANAYIKIEDYEGAQTVIEKAGQTILPTDSIRFLYIQSLICEKSNDYKGAFIALKAYQSLMEDKYDKLFNGDLLFAEKRHELELSSMMDIQKRDRIIWISLSILLIVTILAIILFYRFKLVKADKMLKDQENKNLQLENQQQKLTEENIRLQLSEMEAECENLKALLKTDIEIPTQVSEAIKGRIEILNGLLAEKISGNTAYRKQYEEWVDNIVSDRLTFMNSTRLAFKASHPKFIEYLESYGLTEGEINYLCLYAIGLRGKEVGEYMQLRRHYNISSEIRKKLGIDEHQTNIGIYVRKLLKDL